MPREPSTGSQTDVGDKRGPVRHGPAHPAASERRRENEEAARAAFASGTGRGRLESIGKRPGRSELGEGRFYIEKSFQELRNRSWIQSGPVLLSFITTFISTHTILL